MLLLTFFFHLYTKIIYFSLNKDNFFPKSFYGNGKFVSYSINKTTKIQKLRVNTSYIITEDLNVIGDTQIVFLLKRSIGFCASVLSFFFCFVYFLTKNKVLNGYWINKKMFCKKESTIHTISIFQFKSLKRTRRRKMNKIV